MGKVVQPEILWLKQNPGYGPHKLASADNYISAVELLVSELSQPGNRLCNQYCTTILTVQHAPKLAQLM